MNEDTAPLESQSFRAQEGWIENDELDILSREVRQISEACDDPDLAYFCRQMKGLIEASQSVGKPILV
jgi:hypothetical protein